MAAHSCSLQWRLLRLERLDVIVVIQYRLLSYLVRDRLPNLDDLLLLNQNNLLLLALSDLHPLWFLGFLRQISPFFRGLSYSLLIRSVQLQLLHFCILRFERQNVRDLWPFGLCFRLLFGLGYLLLLNLWQILFAMGFNPGVLQDLCGGRPLGCVFREDSLDEALDSWGHKSAFAVVIVWYLVSTGLDLAVQVALVLGKERQLAHYHNEEDDSAGPNICRLPVIRLLLRQVRAHVLRRAALHRQLLILLASGRKPKINQLDFVPALLVYQNVVKFEVTVHYVDAVHVGHRADNLLENVGSLCLWKSHQWFPFLQAVVEIFAIAELHDEVHVRP